MTENGFSFAKTQARRTQSRQAVVVRCCLKKLICCAACAAMFLTALSACGKDDDDVSALNYEQPLVSMRGSLNSSDETAYLCCYLPQEKSRFMRSEDYKEGFIKDVFNKKDHKSLLQIKVTKSEELSREALDGLEAQARDTYGTRFDFSKGMKADIDFTVSADQEILHDPHEVVLVRYESSWYVYGSVIDSLAFTPA